MTYHFKHENYEGRKRCQPRMARSEGLSRWPERIVSRVVFQGFESGGVLQGSVVEDSSFDNKNDLVMSVESSPAFAG